MENLIYFIIGGFVLYFIFKKGDTTNEDSPNTEGRKISSKDYATLEEGILNPNTFLSSTCEELPEGHDDISIVISADLREMIFKMTEYAGTDEYLLSEDEDGKLWIKKTRHISYPEKLLDYRDSQTERVWDTNPITSELSFTPEEYKKKRLHWFGYHYRVIMSKYLHLQTIPAIHLSLKSVSCSRNHIGMVTRYYYCKCSNRVTH